MKILFVILIIYFLPAHISAQTANTFSGMVVDKKTNEHLQRVSISIYQNGKTSASITNEEGKFYLKYTTGIDSIKFSMIGYNNKVVTPSSINNIADITVMMEAQAVLLDEVFIKPMSAYDLILKAAKSSASLLPDNDFENTEFYREVIKSKEEYFSVAEAIFNTQYIVSDKSYKLRLEKGRSKEDVAATRLFEDFHPGGGPEALSELSFSTGFPYFLNPEKMKWFEYNKNSVTDYDGKKIFVIDFDQKEGVHKALDKGKIYIDSEDYSIVRYEAYNSPRGMPYIKDLTGTDKIFAEILHIDFEKKGWMKQVSFRKTEGKLVMNNAKQIYYIDYKQSKKNLDLSLTITTESVVTDNSLAITDTITRRDKWNRKNIVANLPNDFDADFWGSNNIISPTDSLKNIINIINKKNKEVNTKAIDTAWQYFQKNTFVTAQQNDSIILIPVIKNNWEDDETGGMIFQEATGDFTIETFVNLIKRSNPAEAPDMGFQQSGLIVRDGRATNENNIILCVGTGGNSVPKFFVRKTENGKSKSTVDKIDALKGFLKLEKKGSEISAYFRPDAINEWKTINSYQVKWPQEHLQVGIMLQAHFAGRGPKMKPDMKAIFTGFSITKNN